MTLNPRGVFMPATDVDVHGDTRARTGALEQQDNLADPSRRWCLTALSTGMYGAAKTGIWVPHYTAVHLEVLDVHLDAALGFDCTVSLRMVTAGPVTTLLATTTVTAGGTDSSSPPLGLAPFGESIPPGARVWFTFDTPAHTGPTGMLTAQAWFAGYGGGSLFFDFGVP